MGRMNLRRLLALAAILNAARGQVSSSWPQDYPGKPSGDFSPEWQSYFEVTEPMPNVTFPIGRNWAGNIPVDRPGHPNDTLFFWAFEKENGSLTANESTQPWGIWLNGGPGSSSMLGLFFENGPLQVANDYSLYANNYSWDKLADYVWIDQPVGTGWATADAEGFVVDEDQMAEDFMNFLANLVKIFPNLKTRPLYLTGESYGGVYIPYITKFYFGVENPPVNLTKIAIGDGAIGSLVEVEQLPTVSVLGTYPQLIGYDPEVYEYFQEQSRLCGYDLNLTYPQDGPFPSLNPPMPVSDEADAYVQRRKQVMAEFVKPVAQRDLFRRREDIARRSVAFDADRAQRKRDLIGRANGTIDPYYLCDLRFEVIDYAFNFSLPWKNNDLDGLDPYDIPNALDPGTVRDNNDASVFLNDDAVRAAIHAPTSKDWAGNILYPFNNSDSFVDPSPEPMVFLDDLATNATERSVHVIIYEGNDDGIVAHLSAEVVIQNTTFGGIQGFTRRPATPWFGDDGQYAGIVHQERNWTYVLFEGAGHMVPQFQPERAFVFLREFVLGNNQTGLVTDSGGTLTVFGGENATLALEVQPGQLGIYVGSASTQSTYTYPSATIAAWNSFFATVTSTSFTRLPAPSDTSRIAL